MTTMKKKSGHYWLFGAAIGACTFGAVLGPVGLLFGVIIGAGLGVSLEEGRNQAP